MVLKECLARLKQAKFKPRTFLGSNETKPKVLKFCLKLGNAVLCIDKFNGQVLNLTLHAPDLKPAAVAKPQGKL